MDIMEVGSDGEKGKHQQEHESAKNVKYCGHFHFNFLKS